MIRPLGLQALDSMERLGRENTGVPRIMHLAERRGHRLGLYLTDGHLVIQRILRVLYH